MTHHKLGGSFLEVTALERANFLVAVLPRWGGREKAYLKKGTDPIPDCHGWNMLGPGNGTIWRGGLVGRGVSL